MLGDWSHVPAAGTDVDLVLVLGQYACSSTMLSVQILRPLEHLRPSAYNKLLTALNCGALRSCPGELPQQAAADRLLSSAV